MHEMELETLMLVKHKSEAARKCIEFQRAESARQRDHVIARHKKEARETLEAQELEARCVHVGGARMCACVCVCCSGCPVGQQPHLHHGGPLQ
jgi:hypothetical protein